MADPFETPGFDSPEPAVICDQPGCDHEETGRTAKMRMGLHKRKVHGIAGQDASRGRNKKAEPSRRQHASPSARKPTTAAIQKEIAIGYQAIGSVIGWVDPVCGGAIQAQAEPAARFWAEWAKINPAVADFWLGAGEKVGGIHIVMLGISAHLPILLAINGHHLAPRAQARRDARQAQADEALFGPGFVPDDVPADGYAEPAEPAA